jgi:hypothetical protein
MKGNIIEAIEIERLNVSVKFGDQYKNGDLIVELLEKKNYLELCKTVEDNFKDYYSSGLIPEKGDQLKIEISLLNGESEIKLKEKKSLLTIFGEVDVVWWSRKGFEPKPRFTFTITQVF